MGIQVRRRLAKPMVFGPRGFKSHPRRFLINPLGSFPLDEIVSFGLMKNDTVARNAINIEGREVYAYGLLKKQMTEKDEARGASL